MPWHIVEGHSECATSEPWAVVKDSDGTVEGCHETRAEAEDHMAALYASETDDDARSTVAANEEQAMTATPIELAVDPEIDHPCVDESGDGVCDECGEPCEVHPPVPEEGNEASTTGVAFVGIATVLDYETEDGRLIESDGFSWRTLPLPLMYQDTNPAFGGHEGAVLIGRIEEVAVEDRRVWMRGVFDLNASERAESIVEMVRAQTARFVSVDLSAADAEYEVRSVDEDGWPVDVLARFSNAVMAGATVTPFPAIPDAVIWLDGESAPTEASTTLPEPPEPVDEPEVVESDGPMLLIASGADDLPSAAFFADPNLDGPTPLTIEGMRVFGHVALWGVCHIGQPGCVTAPSSPTDYAYFHTGATLVRCDCGERDGGCDDVLEIATGVLTLDTGHAGLALDGPHALAHYEDTGTAVADVVAGEDRHGVWISGRIRPGVTDAQIAALRGASPSGDWRRIGGALEMVAVLAVNVPGFPVPRTQSRLVASSGGMVESTLIAPADPRLDVLVGGARTRGVHASDVVVIPGSEWRALQRRLERLESVADALRAQAADALAASLS